MCNVIIKYIPTILLGVSLFITCIVLNSAYSPGSCKCENNVTVCTIKYTYSDCMYNNSLILIGKELFYTPFANPIFIAVLTGLSLLINMLICFLIKN